MKTKLLSPLAAALVAASGDGSKRLRGIRSRAAGTRRKRTVMKRKWLGLIACMALLASAVAANASPYVVTLEEVGSNVVATGSGQIDLTGLSFFISQGGYVSGFLVPADKRILTGAGGQVDLYDGSISGPSVFGSGSETIAGSGSGDNVGLFGTGFFAVPSGYVSGTSLSDISTYDNTTLASLGATPGTYVWTWGAGADQSFTLEIGTTPLPATLPLFAGGLGFVGYLTRRRKQAVAAAWLKPTIRVCRGRRRA